MGFPSFVAIGTFGSDTLAAFRMDFLKSGCLGKKPRFLRLHFSCPRRLCICHFKKSVGFGNEMICLRLGKLAERVACQTPRWPPHPAGTVVAVVPPTRRNCFFFRLFHSSHVHRPAVFDQRFLHGSRSVCL